MSSEQLVGSVSYELSIRGPNLQVASSSIFKSKSIDLIELKDSSAFQECRKTTLKVNEPIKTWLNEQKELIEHNMTTKEVENLKIDKHRN